MTGGLGNAATLALIAIVPLVVLTLTSFVKLSVVLSLLRNAIGTPDAPSALVVTGLSLVLTFFVMSPVVVDMALAAAHAPAGTPGPTPAAPAPTTAADARPSFDHAVRELVPDQYHPQLESAERAVVPLAAFLAHHATARDKDTFVALARQLGHTVTGDELWVLAPAFITTELREAFAIALLLFLPFLVVDLVVGLGLSALGLQATSPQTVALPLKLLLFVAVDGWRLLLEALLRGYA